LKQITSSFKFSWEAPCRSWSRARLIYKLLTLYKGCTFLLTSCVSLNTRVCNILKHFWGERQDPLSSFSVDSLTSQWSAKVSDTRQVYSSQKQVYLVGIPTPMVGWVPPLKPIPPSCVEMTTNKIEISNNLAKFRVH
jgi:hypothetical protein